ncbi:hypothetical protein CEE39_04850 [bacterium (candidate division B38) B3_B38]|nr:MAG: hypothetical protein CEE39_04850 [bacterium (candidate division B38) B3_B38]
MWLKALECFAVAERQSLFFGERNHLLLGNFREQVKVINEVLQRITQLAILLLGEERWNMSRFSQYIEDSIQRELIIKETYLTVEDEIDALFTCIAHMRVVTFDFINLKSISYLSFDSYGKIINRAINSQPALMSLKQNKFHPYYDKIYNKHISEVVKSITNSQLRQDVAKIFLILFRLLHYLEFVPSRQAKEGLLKRSLPIFSLFDYEAGNLYDFLKEKYLRKKPFSSSFSKLADNFIFSSKFELRKVFHVELTNIYNLYQEELIFTRIDNSQGILTNYLKQWIVQFAHQFKKDLKGEEIFSDFIARLEESLKLRKELWQLLRLADIFQKEKSYESYKVFFTFLRKFEKERMRCLMYRDWSDFKGFIQDFRMTHGLPNLLITASKFSNYLTILFQQVGRRSVLSAHPFETAEASGEGSGDDSLQY